MASSYIVAHKLSTNLNLKPHQSLSGAAFSWNPISKVAYLNFKNEIRLWRYLTNDLSNAKRKSVAVYARIPGGPMPSTPPPKNSGYMGWLVGFVVSFILPFFNNKMGPLWVLKSRIESAVQQVEDLAEVVEKVAGEVDKIAEDLGDDLPEGQFKKMVKLVEHAAEKTAKTADALDDAIDKVQEVNEQLEDIVENIAMEKAKKGPK